MEWRGEAIIEATEIADLARTPQIDLIGKPRSLFRELLSQRDKEAPHIEMAIDRHR
jgi:hypothetical protein